VTSDGHPHAIFRRAIERRNVVAAWGAAHELPQLSLADALALCLLICDREPRRYPTLAGKWLARYCLEHQATIDEALIVAAGLSAVRTRETADAAVTLAD
jgi:hypothetical protein